VFGWSLQGGFENAARDDIGVLKAVSCTIKGKLVTDASHCQFTGNESIVTIRLQKTAAWKARRRFG